MALLEGAGIFPMDNGHGSVCRQQKVQGRTESLSIDDEEPPSSPETPGVAAPGVFLFRAGKNRPSSVFITRSCLVYP